MVSTYLKAVFEILFGMLILFMVVTSPCVKWVVQLLNFKALSLDVREGNGVVA